MRYYGVKPINPTPPASGDLFKYELDPSTDLTDGKRIDWHGAVSSNTSYKLTDYIDVGDRSWIYIFSTTTYGQASNKYCCVFDENKDPLDKQITVTGGMTTLPTGSRYIRISDVAGFMDGITIIMTV